jgi:hypothetical protein
VPPPFKLSILIVNTNSKELLLGCLRSIYETVETIPFEIIVVDNASTDGSVDAVKAQFPRVRLIENSYNNWFTGATNQAIIESSGQYLLCLNPDTVCHPHAIDALVGFLDRSLKAGAVGPKLLNGDGTLQPSCRNFLTSRRLVLQHIFPWRKMPNKWRKRTVLEYWDHDETMKVDWIIGACILVRRDAIEEIGLKDEMYPIFHEETDWCYRLKQAGWETWFLHSAAVTHFGSQTVSKLWGKGLVLEFYKGKHRFIRKHYGVPTLILHRFLLSGMLLTRLILAAFRGVLFQRSESREQISIVLKALKLQMGF